MADRTIDFRPPEAAPVPARREPPAPAGARVAGSRQRDRAASPPAVHRSPGATRAVQFGTNWAVQPGTDGAVPRGTNAAVPRTPPPRPAVAAHLAQPIAPAEVACPRSVRASAWLWFAACAAGALGGLAALADGNALRDRLTTDARAADPAATAAAVDDAVLATVLVVLGAVATLVVLAVVWTAFLLCRRSWARWLLLVTGLLMLLVGDVALSLVTGGADLDRIGLTVQLALVVPAMGLLIAHSTRAWLRRDAD